MNLFIWGCQFLWFLCILHREICLMNDNYMLFHCLKESKAEKTLFGFGFFFLFKISNGIQKRRPRQLNSGGNQFNVVINSIPPPRRIKRLFVLCYKPLPNSCMADTLAALQGGSWRWRMGVSTMQWLCWVRRARGGPGQLVLGSPLPNFFPLMQPGRQVQWHGFGWAWTPNPSATGGGEVPPCFSSASWSGCSLGGWAALSWQPQLQNWLQKLAAPGWEHDLMQARM